MVLLTCFFRVGINDELYMSGRFDTVGNLAAHNFAKWNGKKWSPIGQGINAVIMAMQFV